GLADDQTRPAYHLYKVLEALRETADQPLNLLLRSPAEVQAADFARAEVTFLVDVPDLPDASLAALEDRVRSGAGLALILGESAKPGFLNEKLYQSDSPARGLLPNPVRRDADDAGERLTPLTTVQWAHPLLAGLGDPLIGDLGQTSFRQWYRFVGDLPTGTIALARIGDDVPALLERNVGSGKVLIFNTGGGDRWSDLGRRKSF